MTWQTTLKGRRASRSTAQSTPTLRLLWGPWCGTSDAGPRALDAGQTPLGRAVAADGIGIPEDPRVSRQHAMIAIGAGRESVELCDCSSTQSYVNGVAAKRCQLQDGDLLRLGDTFFCFRHLPDPEEAAANTTALFGRAPGLRAVRNLIKPIGRSGSTVLVIGESGTGKELAARALHDASGRKGAFVAVNCGAIAESLAESQLFGHRSGAYTGASAAAEGFFRAADQGTLFLDEIGELSPALQPKLLRALEERAVTPVGATAPVTCDSRIVCATNRNLLDEVSAGRFRGDLYARLSEFTLEMPPLRERREDILPLFERALGDDSALTFEPELVEALLLHRWPFNVRELNKLAGQARLRAKPGQCLPLSWFEAELASHAALAAVDVSEVVSADAKDKVLVKLAPVPDRDELSEMLRRHRGVIADIARETGRSRKQVYRWLESHNLDPQQFRQA